MQYLGYVGTGDDLLNDVQNHQGICSSPGFLTLVKLVGAARSNVKQVIQINAKPVGISPDSIAL